MAILVKTFLIKYTPEATDHANDTKNFNSPTFAATILTPMPFPPLLMVIFVNSFAGNA